MYAIETAMTKREVDSRNGGAGSASIDVLMSSSGLYMTPEGHNGGLLEHAQQMAAHESARTTKLYDRRNDKVALDEGRTNCIVISGRANIAIKCAMPRTGNRN